MGAVGTHAGHQFGRLAVGVGGGELLAELRRRRVAAVPGEHLTRRVEGGSTDLCPGDVTAALTLRGEGGA